MAATAALVVAFGAVTFAVAPAFAADPLRLTVGSVGEIGSLDPRTGDSEVAREVWKLQYPTLTSLDPKTLEPVPGTASAWTPAPGGRGWVYKLRPGVAWSDGKAVTAEDVVYSLEQARDDHWPYAGDRFDGLEARAIDERTVAVTSNSKRSPELLLHVVPEHVYEKVDNLNDDLAALGVSDGAWHVVAKSADSVQLDTIHGEFGPAPQQIVFRTYPDTGAMIDALADGEVDVISGIPAADVSRVSALPHVTVDPVGEPPVVQAFRTDNVTGFLREPQIPSLVVFAPTVSQYGQLVAAGAPPGESSSNTVYAVGAVIVLVLCGVTYLVATRIRRHYVQLEETPAHG